jgi:hypothetical protein
MAWSRMEKDESTLLQVLVSIQALILVAEPFFNEPGDECMIGTMEGKVESEEYNNNIRFETLRHAILEQMRNPSVVFSKEIQAHFMIKKKPILAQLSEWKSTTPKATEVIDDIITILTTMDGLSQVSSVPTDVNGERMM